MLLDENTVTYIFDEENEEEAPPDSDSSHSLFVEPGHTRRYHRCFKLNLTLNIFMLITFVALILFGHWYYMAKTDAATGVTY